MSHIAQPHATPTAPSPRAARGPGAPRTSALPPVLALCALSALGAWICLTAPGCQPAQDGPTAEKFVETREVMGTLATITVIAEGGRDAVAPMEAAFAALESVNALMSAYVPDSDIGRLNQADQGERVRVSQETFAVLGHARQCTQLGQGAFDVTVGPLLDLWRTAAAAGREPSAAELESVRTRVGIAHLGIDAASHEVWFERDGMRVDLGGIAKGYGIDRTVATLREHGIEAGIVEVGGDLRCFGQIPEGLIGKQATLPVRTLRRKGTGPVGEDESAQPPEGYFPGLRRTDRAPLTPRRPWPLGIQSPFGEELLGKITLAGGAVATSGHYRRYATINGTRFSHILDARSGWPVAAPASVTVIAEDALTADALATTITALGLPAGLVLADSLPGVAALIVEGSAEHPVLHPSAGFPRIKPVKNP